MIILTKKVALNFFKIIRDIAHEPFKTIVFLCSYVEMTLNLKWLVSRCHMLIGVGYCQNINCEENKVLSLMNDFNHLDANDNEDNDDDVIVDENPLGHPLSPGRDCISWNNIINYYSHDQNYYQLLKMLMMLILLLVLIMLMLMLKKAVVIASR